MHFNATFILYFVLEKLWYGISSLFSLFNINFTSYFDIANYFLRVFYYILR